MATSLPQFVAISSSSTSKTKYFRPSGPNGELKSEEVGKVTPSKVMHEVVPTSRPEVIHLKCVDTREFWSWGQKHASNDYISAQQKEKVSDRSSKACTLIKYSHHTRNGASVYHLEFLRNSEWHAIKKDSQGFLKSGESRGECSYTNFVIEDWHKAASAIRNQNNTGAGTSGGNIIINVAIPNLNINNPIIMIPGTSQPPKNICNGPARPRLLDGKDKAKK